jgi:hypothetical protein
MNIFLLDLDVVKAAQAHADKHVVKMLLEACQLLYTAHWAIEYEHILEYRSPAKLAIIQKHLCIPTSIQTAPPSITRPDEPGFRPCHIHHPCAVWVRETLQNYLFLAKLAVALADEFKYRYPKKGPHACEKHAHWLLDNYPIFMMDTPMTPFVQAMDPQYKRADAVEAYRNYYLTSKKERGLLVYKFRPPPDWIDANQHNQRDVLSNTTVAQIVDAGDAKN